MYVTQLKDSTILLGFYHCIFVHYFIHTLLHSNPFQHHITHVHFLALLDRRGEASRNHTHILNQTHFFSDSTSPFDDPTMFEMQKKNYSEHFFLTILHVSPLDCRLINSPKLVRNHIFLFFMHYSHFFCTPETARSLPCNVAKTPPKLG